MRKSQFKGLQVSPSPILSTHTYFEDILALGGWGGGGDSVSFLPH